MKAPKVVLELADDLRRACKTEPVVEWDGSRARWRVTVSNNRVTMTVDYKLSTGGRWVWGSSTLAIDGVKGPLAAGFDHFVRVWNNPEELNNRLPVPPPITTPITQVPLDEMPDRIADAVGYAVERKGAATLTTGYVSDDFWAVDFSSDRATLRLHWFYKDDVAEITEHIFLIVDGEDRSDLAKGKMDKALAVFSSIPHLSAAGPASIDSAASTQRDRGVEVRSTHVIRN